MPHVFLESVGKPLLVLHALVAAAMLGACTHLVVVTVGLLRGRTHLARLARLYAQVIGGTFAVAYTLGLLVYPNYRYFVRGLYLDRYAVWASNLFDIKEIFAGLALPLALALFFVGRGFDASRDAALTPFLAYLAFAMWLLVAVAAVSGLIITTVRSV